MARGAEGAALMLQVLAGHDARDPACVRRAIPDYREGFTKTIRGCKLGVARQFFFEDCDLEVEAAVENAVHVLRDLGAIIVDVELPDMWVCHRMGSLIIAVEGAAYHANALRERPERFSDEMLASFGLGNFYTGVQYVQAQRLRRHLTVETQNKLEGFDALITPTSPVPTTRIADDPPGHVCCGLGTRYRLILLVCRQYRSLVALLPTTYPSACRLPVKPSMNKAYYESPARTSRPQAGITSTPRNRLHTKRTPRTAGFFSSGKKS